MQVLRAWGGGRRQARVWGETAIDAHPHKLHPHRCPARSILGLQMGLAPLGCRVSSQLIYRPGTPDRPSSRNGRRPQPAAAVRRGPEAAGCRGGKGQRVCAHKHGADGRGSAGPGARLPAQTLQLLPPAAGWWQPRRQPGVLLPRVWCTALASQTPAVSTHAWYKLQGVPSWPCCKLPAAATPAPTLGHASATASPARAALPVACTADPACRASCARGRRAWSWRA